MLSADDADNLGVPLGLFISKDEPKEEYDKMIQKLQSKPYADKLAYKVYPNMYVSPSTPCFICSLNRDVGSTAGRLHALTLTTKRTRKNSKTCTPSLAGSSRVRLSATAAEPRRAFNRATVK